MDEEAVMELTENQETAVNSDGIMYLTAGSSSGSKYYDLVPRQQTYIAHRWQEDVPTYSVVDVTENSLTINTYRTDNDEKIDETFSITKSKGDTTSLNAEIKASESIVKQKMHIQRKAIESLNRHLQEPKKLQQTKKQQKMKLKMH